MKNEKLLRRLLSKPTDFTFEELRTLLSSYGYQLDNRGKTSGSAITFFCESNGDMIMLHRPHSPKVLRPYQINDVIKHLKEKGML